MATMKRWALGTTSADFDVGVNSVDEDGYMIVHLSGTLGSGTVTFKGYLRGKPKVSNTQTDGSSLSASDADTLPYYSKTGSVTSGATAANALGIFRVWVPAGVSVILSYTAGGGSDLVATTNPSTI